MNVETRPCWVCAEPMTKKPGKGRWPRYCSAICKTRARPVTRPRQTPRPMPQTLACEQCGADFESRRPTRAKYCGGSCRARATRLRDLDAYRAGKREWSRAKYAPHSSVAFIICRWCGELSSARMSTATRCRKIECRRAWKRQARSPEKRRADREKYGYTEATAEAYHRRRALKKGATVERFSHVEVFDRDGWICGICSDPVDREAKWPSPLSVSLDHIVPLALGGAHSRANTQCSHLSCNVRKGARAA